MSVPFGFGLPDDTGDGRDGPGGQGGAFDLGSLGAANRAFVGYLAPAGREGETFGLWGMVFKLSAIMTFPFAWMKDTVGTPAALALLTAFLAVGLLLTLGINESRGRAAALRS